MSYYLLRNLINDQQFLIPSDNLYSSWVPPKYPVNIPLYETSQRCPVNSVRVVGRDGSVNCQCVGDRTAVIDYCKCIDEQDEEYW